MYFWYKGMYPFDVPKEGRSLLALRSLIYCLGFIMFMRSMEFLNPLVALITHQTGIGTYTVVIRMIYRTGKERAITAILIKFIVTAIILF